MNETVNRKYILALSATAVLILGVGAWLKPKKAREEQPSPSETASLQLMVRREDLKRTASFFSERALAMASYVVYLPENKSTGLFWDGSRGLLAPAADSDTDTPLLNIVRYERAIGLSPAYSISDESGGGRWILLVGRAPDRSLVWTAAIEGGGMPASCDGIPYRELVIAANLNPSLAGFAAFDLDGKLAGMVMRCGDSYHVISSRSIAPMLNSLQAPERRLRAAYGIRVEPLDPSLVQRFSGENGLLLVEVSKPGAAYRSGLRAGDLLLSANGARLSSAGDLWAEAANGSSDSSPKITALRGARQIQIDLRSPSAPPDDARHPLGIDVSVLPAALDVDPESEGYRLGLRTGDRVVQAGNIGNPTAAQLRRILARSAQTPALLIYERGSRQIATVASQ